MFNYNAQALNNEYRQRQEAIAERNRFAQSVTDKTSSKRFPTIANTLKRIIASTLHEESVMTVRDTQTVPNVG